MRIEEYSDWVRSNPPREETNNLTSRVTSRKNHSKSPCVGPRTRIKVGLTWSLRAPVAKWGEKTKTRPEAQEKKGLIVGEGREEPWQKSQAKGRSGESERQEPKSRY